MGVLLFISYVATLFGSIKIIYDMLKKKKWREIRKSPEFIILILSLLSVGFCYIPWNEIHFGKEKIIYVDSSKIRKNENRNSQKPPADTNKSNPVISKEISVGRKKTNTHKTNNGKSNDNNNSVTVQGSPGSIIVGGVNNKVFINQEDRLTDYGISKIGRSVDSMVAVHNLPKMLIISTYSYFNAPLVMQQLQEYFKNKGYVVNTTGSIMSTGDMVVGYHTGYSTGESVELNLGYFKKL